MIETLAAARGALRADVVRRIRVSERFLVQSESLLRTGASLHKGQPELGIRIGRNGLARVWDELHAARATAGAIGVDGGPLASLDGVITAIGHAMDESTRGATRFGRGRHGAAATHAAADLLRGVRPQIV